MTIVMLFRITLVIAAGLARADAPRGTNGTGLVRLTPNGSSDGTPEWAPTLTEPK